MWNNWINLESSLLQAYNNEKTISNSSTKLSTLVLEIRFVWLTKQKI